MIIATCGHEVDEGISCSVDLDDYGYDIDGNSVKMITYGTFCHACVLRYYKENRLLNNEIKKMITLLTNKKSK